MKMNYQICALATFLFFAAATDAADVRRTDLDVLKMQEVPQRTYEVALQLEGQVQSVTIAVKNNRASFVKATSPKLEGLSGDFDLIGNGVFLARLSGKNHRASQWWIFRPDGTATVKEIPDRGEKQIAKPVSGN
jgi:hypothetical protein